MRRRDFIAAPGGAAVWSALAKAQQAGRIPVGIFLAYGCEYPRGKFLRFSHYPPIGVEES
jgi:hypothetical protein